MTVSQYLFGLGAIVAFLTMVRLLKTEGLVLGAVIFAAALYYS